MEHPGPVRSYDELLEEGRRLHPGVDIGRPGRSRAYPVILGGLRALRVRYDVDLHGGEHLAPGAAVIVGNHVSALDPVCAVLTSWRRVVAFTKVEMFEGGGAAFFRGMGQIPLRRGDEASTAWALEMAGAVLREGASIGVYPEGTRSPDGRLHRLHKRVLVPLLVDNPGVPVHAMTVRYEPRRPPRRNRVAITVSPRLDLSEALDDPEHLVTRIREALQATSGQEYVHEYARDVKRRLAAERSARRSG
ncbi:MAG TPA: lysophospholipid acyltransferase family protein [Jiangellales bacterium]|nr:lysophospholipid acyltransferase family protein [Jiangellales bacterium]